ncbi:MAG: hypothetical protein Q8S53_07810 [Brevundimonas sp.]|uniref:hypothetical protein n=1 Tax=Brevundimonas sp. TaxID=1871086 RepID=UPI0027323732|nr:hypothetical protein [Brevundimonas sp.]MDP3378258.1 hypothetical protein [Brevundimonas sp.]
MARGWLLDELGRDFVVLALGQPAPEGTGLRAVTPAVNDHLPTRYLGDQAQAIYLIRPDQVVAARWISATADEIKAALAAAWRGA